MNYNYDGAGHDADKDLRAIRKAESSSGRKFDGVRMLIEQYNYTAGVDRWKTYTQKALDLGFNKVIFGLTNPTYTAGNQSAFNTAQQGIASWMQSINDPRLVLCIGNEEMYHHDGSISDASVRANMRTLYTACKAIYTIPGSKITYSMANGEMFQYKLEHDGGAIWPWDYASANLYSYPHGSTTSGTYFSINLSSAIAWFGSTFVISEFGPDPNGYSDGAWGEREIYADHFYNQLLDIIDHNIPEAAIYNYMDGAFGCKSPNGTYRPHWYLLRGLPIPMDAGME